jgi:hypothetical protein
VSVELNVDGDIVARELPWVEVEPVVWDFNLFEKALLAGVRLKDSNAVWLTW